jgi:hypothetical protein
VESGRAPHAAPRIAQVSKQMVDSRQPQEVLKALHPEPPPQEEIVLTLEDKEMNCIILPRNVLGI